jgi:hypothetical protein
MPAPGHCNINGRADRKDANFHDMRRRDGNGFPLYGRAVELRDFLLVFDAIAELEVLLEEQERMESEDAQGGPV